MHTAYTADNLTDAEQELMRGAVGNRGVLEIVSRAETHGPIVVAGKKRFHDPQDRSVAERYLGLIVRLKELELIREVSSKKAYELTNSGWELSRRLGRQRRELTNG